MSYDPFRLLETLARHDVAFIVIGAVAAWLQGNPAVTMDLDITPEQDVDNAERLAAAINELMPRAGGDIAVVDDQVFLGWRSHTFLTDAGRLDIVPEVIGVGNYVDLLPRCVMMSIDDVTIMVASIDDIIASKEALDRPKDRLHLEMLRDTARQLRDRDQE